MVGYLQLAHNRRVAGVTGSEVRLNLGREEQLDVEGLRGLARSLARSTEGVDPVGSVGGGAAGGLVSLLAEVSHLTCPTVYRLLRAPRNRLRAARGWERRRAPLGALESRSS